MESYVRPILFLLSCSILIYVLFVLVKNWLDRRELIKQQEMISNLDPDPHFTLNEDENLPFASPDNSDELLVLSVMAKDGQNFGSYDLLQVISAAGLKFGEMNIFHYYADNKTLFSLVSAKAPGDFNLDKMGDFSCPGLMLFMHLKSTPNQRETFYLMLSAAEHLADDLDGELCADPKTPWSQIKLSEYLTKIEQVEALGIL